MRNTIHIDRNSLFEVVKYVMYDVMCIFVVSNEYNYGEIHLKKEFNYKVIPETIVVILIKR